MSAILDSTNDRDKKDRDIKIMMSQIFVAVVLNSTPKEKESVIHNSGDFAKELKKFLQNYAIQHPVIPDIPKVIVDPEPIHLNQHLSSEEENRSFREKVEYIILC